VTEPNQPVAEPGRRLQDRVCVITGSASGVGRVSSLLFARHGAIVVGFDIDGDGGRETLDLVEQAGGRGSFIEGDVSDPAAASALREHCNRAHGKVDVLFNNAGIVVHDQVDSFDLDSWNRAMAVNVTGPLLCAQALAPMLAVSGRGSIVNHSSVDGVLGNPHLASYSASKAALNSMTRLMAHTYGKLGIRANAISSGNLSTSTSGSPARINNVFRTADLGAWTAMHEQILENTPSGRPGSVEEAATVALFFASDDSTFVSGVSLVTTGGRGMLTPGTTVDIGSR